MKRDDPQVIVRMYDLLKWYLGRLEKFPRSHRYGLGQRIESTLYGIFEGLVRARYQPRQVKSGTLASLNLELEILRMQTRLANELALMSHKSYEYAARETDEVGRMVGGWLKQQRANRSLSS